MKAAIFRGAFDIQVEQFPMRPFLSQRTPSFKLPTPVSAEPTCGPIGVRDSTSLAGKSAMNGWALLRTLAQRSEPSSEETA